METKCGLPRIGSFKRWVRVSSLAARVCRAMSGALVVGGCPGFVLSMGI